MLLRRDSKLKDSWAKERTEPVPSCIKRVGTAHHHCLTQTCVILEKHQMQFMFFNKKSLLQQLTALKISVMHCNVSKA